MSRNKEGEKLGEGARRAKRSWGWSQPSAVIGGKMKKTGKPKEISPFPPLLSSLPALPPIGRLSRKPADKGACEVLCRVLGPASQGKV